MRVLDRGAKTYRYKARRMPRALAKCGEQNRKIITVPIAEIESRRRALNCLYVVCVQGVANLTADKIKNGAKLRVPMFLRNLRCDPIRKIAVSEIGFALLHKLAHVLKRLARAGGAVRYIKPEIRGDRAAAHRVSALCERAAQFAPPPKFPQLGH